MSDCADFSLTEYIAFNRSNTANKQIQNPQIILLSSLILMLPITL